MDDMQRDPATSPTASATGTVHSVDASAGTVTIDHGPVDALRWPAMTMTFQAPDVELGAIEKGDQVSFEFTSTGRSEEHTSELQSLMRISYAVFCLTKTHRTRQTYTISSRPLTQTN